jgi:hypothetical protein
VVCLKSQSLESLALQESLKRLHDASDELRISHQRVRYADRISKFVILDMYLRGEISILFDVEPTHKLDNVRGALKLSGRSGASPSFAMLVTHFDTTDMSDGENGDKKPMLVSNVQFVNGPNGLIPSRARLYLVEHKAEQARASDVYFGLAKGTFRFFDGLVNREFSSVAQESGREILNRPEPCVVESGMQIVDSIPDHQGDIVESLNICKIMSEDFTSSFRMDIYSSGVSFMQKCNPRFNVREMLIGPVYLKPGIGESHG